MYIYNNILDIFEIYYIYLKISLSLRSINSPEDKDQINIITNV